MKPFWNILKLLLPLFLLSACDIGEDEVNYHFVSLKTLAVDMPEEFRLNETYEIGVTVLEPNGCTEFEGFDILPEDTTIRRVVAIGTEQNDVPCTEALSEVETSFDFICLYPGTYVFRFWTGKNQDGVDQFMEFEVPVVP
ncbi:hypothetical protein [Robiginitalea sp.]|uniref:hypothetical protein n=2 Tax=Robiginitalea sp. TaxID=1902411 RepID=UPI003C73A238